MYHSLRKINMLNSVIPQNIMLLYSLTRLLLGQEDRPLDLVDAFFPHASSTTCPQEFKSRGFVPVHNLTGPRDPGTRGWGRLASTSPQTNIGGCWGRTGCRASPQLAKQEQWHWQFVPAGLRLQRSPPALFGVLPPTQHKLHGSGGSGRRFPHWQP